ncbi:hypothetical protein ACNS7O_18860 (plasmid) [Haloferacaceae archaeon DSL9]
MSFGTSRFSLSAVTPDLLAALAGLLAALAIFPVRFLVSHIYIQTLPIVLAIACLIYLLAVYQNRNTEYTYELPSTVSRLLPSVTILGMAVLFLFAGITGGRGSGFYDLAAVVGTLLVVQIAFTRDADLHPGLLIGQVIAFAAVIRFSALLMNPGLIGIDIWTHVVHYSGDIQTAQSLDPISQSKYYASPLYHLLTVLGAEFFGISLRNALYLTLGVAMPLSVVLIYATSRLFIPVRWAILATAVYAFSDYVILWGIHLIPTSMGLVFFLATLYLLMRLLHTGYRTSDFALIVLFSVLVILTHQISTFIMLVLFGAGFLAQLLLRIDYLRDSTQQTPFLVQMKKPVNLFGLLVFDLGFIIFMWSMTPYQGDTFLTTVLSYFQSTLESGLQFGGSSANEAPAAAAAEGGPSLAAQLATYFDMIGFFMLLFIGVIGCLVVLRRKLASQATFTMLAAIVVMLFMVLGLPMIGIRNFVPPRWYAFLYAPLILVGIAGLYHLSRNISAPVFVAVMLVFVLIFPGVMLVSSSATPDAPLFPSERERLAYTDTELAAVYTIGEMYEANENDMTPLRTDHPYQTVFSRTTAHPAEPIELTNDEQPRPVEHQTVVYRPQQSEGTSFFRTDFGALNRNFAPEEICPDNMNRIYGNGDVHMCTAPSA